MHARQMWNYLCGSLIDMQPTSLYAPDAHSADVSSTLLTAKAYAADLEKTAMDDVDYYVLLLWSHLVIAW